MSECIPFLYPVHSGYRLFMIKGYGRSRIRVSNVTRTCVGVSGFVFVMGHGPLVAICLFVNLSSCCVGPIG
jgi:hypothetical protein